MNFRIVKCLHPAYSTPEYRIEKKGLLWGWNEEFLGEMEHAGAVYSRYFDVKKTREYVSDCGHVNNRFSSYAEAQEYLDKLNTRAERKQSGWKKQEVTAADTAIPAVFTDSE